MLPVTYPVVEVLPEWAPRTEGMGSKPKFWYSWPEQGESLWLFKYPREGRGEHWAEKIVAELAAILQIPCARVELAVFQGIRGSTTRSIEPENYELVHGNEVLESSISFLDATALNFHLADHTLANILLAFERIFPADSDAFTAKLLLAEYLVLDAIVGNIDRHSENWAVLRRQHPPWNVESLSPSYDHGSSLGRELMDERRERWLSENRVAEYAERGRGLVFWDNTGRRGPSPLALIRLAATVYPELFLPAIAKLDRLKESSLHGVVSAIPPDWMSPFARDFAIELMRYSCEQLMETSRND